MKEKKDSQYTLKRLRELCNDIHHSESALLLKETLPNFPSSVIDSFFSGAKITKPSGPDEREWADLVRLALIAFSPLGSEPAKLRGKPLDRYIRANTLDSRDKDMPGVLFLWMGLENTKYIKSYNNEKQINFEYCKSASN
jgi:hypothetical protein